MGKKFVILIDGENFSWRFYEAVILAVKVFGEILEIRIYGDWSEPSMKGWKKILDINPAMLVQVFRDGDNTTDHYIMMEAARIMEARKEINAFCIASSDAIFKNISRYLQSDGKYVLGIGESKSPDIWRKSCNYFMILNSPSVNGDMTHEETFFVYDRDALETALKYGFLYTRLRDGWFLVANICDTIKKGCPDFHWEQRPMKVLKKYEQETGKIEIDEPVSGAFRIREKTKDVSADVPDLGVTEQLNDVDKPSI
jgi:hypothetical protein